MLGLRSVDVVHFRSFQEQTEEAMAAEETSFATTYSLSLASGELTTHGGHVAFSNDLTRPAEILS